MLIVKGLEEDFCACKSFRIRRSEACTEVLIVKGLAKRSYESGERESAGLGGLRGGLTRMRPKITSEAANFITPSFGLRHPGD